MKKNNTVPVFKKLFILSYQRKDIFVLFWFNFKKKVKNKKWEKQNYHFFSWQTCSDEQRSGGHEENGFYWRSVIDLEVARLLTTIPNSDGVVIRAGHNDVRWNLGNAAGANIILKKIWKCFLLNRRFRINQCIYNCVQNKCISSERRLNLIAFGLRKR